DLAKTNPRHIRSNTFISSNVKKYHVEEDRQHTCFKIYIAKKGHFRTEGTMPSIYYIGFSSPGNQ
ncbi:hypothetical protein ACQP3L_35050, partial [Escherichia coli]